METVKSMKLAAEAVDSMKGPLPSSSSAIAFTFKVYREHFDFGTLCDILRRDTRFVYAVSPLHDEGVKPHWHIIEMTASHRAHSSKNALFLVNRLKGQFEPDRFAVGNRAGCERYLVHLDDKEKQQFDLGLDEITLVNGYRLHADAEDKKEARANECASNVARLLLDWDMECFEDYRSALIFYSSRSESDMVTFLWKSAFACRELLRFGGRSFEPQKEHIIDDGGFVFADKFAVESVIK